jgi:hypothetical protein
MEQLTHRLSSHYSDAQPLHARLLLDSIVAPCQAFLVSSPFREQADRAAANLARMIGEVGLASAQATREEGIGMALFEIEKLMQLPNAQTLLASEFVGAVAYRAFELGLYAETYAAVFRDATTTPGNELRDDAARLCALVGDAALASAKSSLYRRGYTSYAPDDAQDAFLARIEAGLPAGT